MAGTAAGTRARILEAAYTLFYRQGFNRTDISDIAAAAQVSKRTLYVHFESKDRLLAESLASCGPLAEAHIAKWADALAEDSQAAVGQLFEDLAACSRTRGWVGSGHTRLCLELADLPGHPAREIARRHKAKVEARIATALARCGLSHPGDRAREICLLIEGACALIVIHGDVEYARLAAEAARDLVRQDREPDQA